MSRFILFSELSELEEMYGDPVEIRYLPEEKEIAFTFQTDGEDVVALLEEVY